MDATFTLVCGLVLQTTLLLAWQAFNDRGVLSAMFRAWRPSLTAGFMGALASQMWFLAFAIAATAHVRTLALVEILFAHALSRRLFSQHTTAAELGGIVLVVASEYQLTHVGLGSAIYNAGQLLDVERLYAALVAVSLLGFGLSVLVDAVERIAIPWRAERRTGL